MRRFLEAYPEFRVVLCVEKAERALYNVLAPLYFPASRAEEEVAVWQLPADIGGPLGEPVDPERQIRIIQNPQHDDAMNRGKQTFQYFTICDLDKTSGRKSCCHYIIRRSSVRCE